MPLPQTMPAARLRAILLTVTSGCLLIASQAGARAADGDGLDFLRQIFNPPPAYAPAPVAQPSVVQPYDAPIRQRVSRRNRLAVQAKALRGRTRYVALPKAEVKPEKADTKPLAIAVSPLKNLDARTALMRDPTLRSGDIVIMPEGPRVFHGDSGTDRHKMSDFQDVNRPGVVASKTRKELLAMTAPIGALPADAARRLMARYQKAGPATEAVTRAEATLTRVVYPAR
ncbi:hypothetical protein NS228_15405 [Methylobacterium indicum]|uniref:Uncharacterized protein n=1 Tax=Methylobacterium indicum TaxID=1775910 RepID=A0A8H8WXG0_9HYPH|nr:hypothetical protein [Methylobacterium indicum]KTS13632.1 hypothetical protein NS229_28735 [Methylobacterium indicum]KTS39433.1 hypothetical protein NS228_15405 [Methylobacterium indicum]KTS44837.1 hypothetical protein NS230_24635 [Methylobacterium indicum]BCM85993.1 hypothetical protein mvi_44540 [Methylobacterium indicum]